MIAERPVFYSFRRCPYAMRARMAVAAAGVEVELREIVLRDKPQQMLEVSPKGTVPVLLLADGSVIDESFEVMLWALAIADPQQWLNPETGSLQAMVDLIACFDGDFKYHLDRYKYANRYEGTVASDHRIAAEEFLRVLEGHLSANVYLFGNRPSLADYAIMPFIRQFANTDRNWFDQAPYPKLQAWLGGLLSSETFRNVMQKYPCWKPEQPVVLFPG